jgi:murein DD-endopeptidase MepM/ murein hydrolase activator NlpD
MKKYITKSIAFSLSGILILQSCAGVVYAAAAPATDTLGASISATPTLIPITVTPEASDGASPIVTPTPIPLPSTPIVPTVAPPGPSIEPSITVTPAPDNVSGRLRLPKYARSMQKHLYRAAEPIAVSIDNTFEPDSNIRVKVTDIGGNEVPVTVSSKITAETQTIQIQQTNTLRPGRYTVEIFDGKTLLTQQDFDWGVLAINPDKSIYMPHDTANFAIAVLNETGDMTCDAQLELKIIDPKGDIVTRQTGDQTITVNPQCSSHNFSLSPDYQTSYQVGENGKYGLVLTATTENGTYAISDSFDVDDQAPFIIQRESATRIYPPHAYPMQITVTANRDFSGTIEESVPQSFSISPLADTTPYSDTVITTDTPTEEATNSASRISLSMPFIGEHHVTQEFGSQMTDVSLRNTYVKFGIKGHDGVDYNLQIGTPVVSVDSGVVAYTGNEPYGKTVIIEHTWGRSYYGHLSRIDVTQGQMVAKGDPIALSGNTGESTGPHLHFGMRLNSYNIKNGYYGKINPLPYLTATTAIISDTAVQKIYWDLTIKSGQTKTLGYTFQIPQASPEFYLTGPLQFRGALGAAESVPDLTPPPEASESAANPLVLGENVATPSVTSEATISPTGTPTSTPTPSPSPTPDIATASGSAILQATLSAQINELKLQERQKARAQQGLVYTEPRQWQIAADYVAVITSEGYTIASVGTLSGITKASTQRKIVYDGTYWWAFYEKSGTANTLFYAYSPDLIIWTESSVALTATVIQDGGAMSIYWHSADDTVMVAYYTSDANHDRYMRGAITGTTITWTANTVYVEAQDRGAGSDYQYQIAEDSTGKALYMDIENYDNPRVIRSTNNISATFADTGAQWTNLSGPAATQYIVDRLQQDIIIPGASSTFLILCDDVVASVPAIAWDRYNGSTWDRIGQYNVLYSTSGTSRLNWGAVKISNTAMYVLGQDTASSFTFRMFDGTSTWTTLANPVWPTSGVVTNSRVSLMAQGTYIYAFLIRGDANNTISYAFYDGVYWSGWTDLTTSAKTRNYIEANFNTQANQAIVTWTETNGANYDFKLMSIAAPDLSALMRHGKSFGSNDVLPYTF